MDGESGDLALEVDELRCAVRVEGARILVDLKAASGKPLLCCGKIVDAKADVALFSSTAPAHNLNERIREYGNGSLDRSEPHESLEEGCNLHCLFRACGVDSNVSYVKTKGLDGIADFLGHTNLLSGRKA